MMRFSLQSCSSVAIIAISALFLVSCSRPKVSSTEYTDIDTSYPVQTELTTIEQVIIEKGDNVFLLTPQAGYRIGAMVARKKRYSDLLSPLSPIDLALVWGVMLQPELLSQISIKQSKRRYWFFPRRNATVPQDWIYLNSSNNHIIPANDNISKALSRVRRKDLVMLEGYLVNVYATIKGRTIPWNTSLDRSDKGDGACEIFYVTKVKHHYRVYE